MFRKAFIYAESRFELNSLVGKLELGRLVAILKSEDIGYHHKITFYLFCRCSLRAVLFWPITQNAAYSRGKQKTHD